MPNFPPAVAVGLSTTPDYDSGWTDISGGATTTFTHNLGTKNLLANIWILRWDGKIMRIWERDIFDSMRTNIIDLPDVNSLIIANSDTVHFVEARVQLWSLD